MSWLTAVTGRAEDFLNKLDKSAADAFSSEQEAANAARSAPITATRFKEAQSLSTGNRNLPPSQSFSSHMHKFNPKDDAASVPISSGVKPTVKSETSSVTASKPPSKKKDSDEALFDFLNSKESPDGSKKRLTPAGSRHHSRQSSTSSQRGNSKTGEADIAGSDAGDGTAVVTAGEASGQVEVLGSELQQQRDSPTNSHTSADLDVLADAMHESPTGSDHSTTHDADSINAQLSALELENRLLRNEIVSLNQEMTSIIQRAKDSQTELIKTKERMSDYMNASSLHDQLVRELQAREIDLQEALKAKDSQLAVLRVQLEDVDRLLAARQKDYNSLQTERDRILQDQSSVSGMHSQTLDTMRHKLEEMEGALTREQLAHKQYQKEAEERFIRLEQERKTLADALAITEKKVSDERAKAAEAHSQLKTLKSSLEATRQEMSEYKDKASRILQSKERLIASLREGSGASGNSEGVSALEYDSVKQERDMMREELQQSKITIEHLHSEVQDIESQLQQESNSAQDAIRSLEEAISEEKHRKEDAEHELLRQKQELQFAVEELHRQKMNFQSRIADRETEIEKLRNQLTTKSLSSVTESELESRVRSLTESLIQKQTVLEALSTEKNSLALQFERLEQQYRDAENTLMRSAMASVNVADHEDDVRQRLPTFMREGVTDTEVTRRMKRYVNTIDKFSIRLGVFLRRYPIARIFVIIYMALLHLWVMIVLATYQPEVHDKDHQPTVK